jgi:hypothetical protein
MDLDFDQYRRAYYEQALPRLARELESAGVGTLERMALRVMFVVEANRVPKFPGSEPMYTILPKLTNELFAFAGCLRAGSLHGAWQHIRGIQEVHGAVHYLYLADPADSAARTNRYVEQGRALPWLRRQHVRNEHAKQRSGGAKLKVSDAHLKRVEAATADACAWVDDAQIARWSQIFQVDVVKKPQRVVWHLDKSISQLLTDAGYDGADDDDENDAAWFYQVLCQPTHVTAVGHRLTAGSGNARLIGWDTEMLVVAIATCAGSTYQLTRVLDKVHPFGLADAISGDVRALLASVSDATD